MTSPTLQKKLDELKEAYPSFIDLSLDRLKSLMNKLGNPELKLPKVIHVAGTNGKGSTLAITESILNEHGYITHKFTSPHLVNFNERIILQGIEVEDDYLIKLIDNIAKINGDGEITYFEFIMAVSFKAFSEFNADFLLLETAMGGRRDATNILENVALSLISKISYDHVETLGNDIKLIAKEKAGIIKDNCPVVIGYQKYDEIIDVFKEEALNKSSEIFIYNKSYAAEINKDGFIYKGINKMELPMPSLLGEFQIFNASLAIAGLERVINLDQEKTANGLKNIKWQGRLQKLQNHTLNKLIPNNWELYIDGMHNDSGAEVIAKQIEEWKKDSEFSLILGVKKENSLGKIFKYLNPLIDNIQLVEFNKRATSLKTDELAKYLKEIDVDNITKAYDIETALKNLNQKFNNNQNRRILITGSLYLIGEILDK